MANVYSFLADGMEEVEALAPVDLLRRAGNPVTTVSVMGRTQIRGSHNILLEADVLFEKADFSDGDLFLLPGGGEGTRNLEEFAPLMKLLRKKYEEGKHIAAICAAPKILAALGMLEGKKATIYPGMEDQLGGAIPQDVPAVTDGLITTGHGVGAALDFGLELVRVLNGDGAAADMKRQIVFQH